MAMTKIVMMTTAMTPVIITAMFNESLSPSVVRGVGGS